MPAKTVAIPPMRPFVQRYQRQYITAITKIKDWPKANLIRYEKTTRRAWRELEGKTEMDRFHIAMYQAVNQITNARFPGLVAPWFSRLYNIQYAVKPEPQRVYIQSNPTGARMWIDDVDTYRSTPNLIYVARDSGDTSRKSFLPGWHRLTLRKTGFSDFITEIYIGAGRGRDNPYKFALAKPSAKRIAAPERRPTQPAAPAARIQLPVPESTYSPSLPSYPLTPGLPSFPPIAQQTLRPRLQTPAVARRAGFPPPSMRPALPAIPSPAFGPPLLPPPPPRFMAGAKVSNSALTFDAIREPFDPTPPLGEGSLGQIRYSKKVFTPATFVPVTQEVLQSRQKLQPGARLAARARYPAKDPWVTDELVRWYADQVNAGTYRPESYDPQQTAVLARWARRRGYIESEMATRQGWLEQRHRWMVRKGSDALISYRAPYSPPIQTYSPPTVPDPSRLVRPTTSTRPVEPPLPSIKKEAGRYYKQIGPSWTLVKDVRGRTPAPRRAGTAKGSYAAGKQAQQRIASERMAWQSKMAKLEAQRGESFRKRQQQIRAQLIRR